jgi:hypothetical protein
MERSGIDSKKAVNAGRGYAQEAMLNYFANSKLFKNKDSKVAFSDFDKTGDLAFIEES